MSEILRNQKPESLKQVESFAYMLKEFAGKPSNDNPVGTGEFLAGPYDSNIEDFDRVSETCGATVLGCFGHNTREALLALVGPLAFRVVLAWPNEGMVHVIPNNVDDEYLGYLRQLGVKARLIKAPNEDLLDPSKVVSILKEQGINRIVPYQIRRALLQLFQRVGLEQEDMKGTADIVDHMRNKHSFRDSMMEAGFEFRYPRAFYGPGADNEEIQKFIEAITRDVFNSNIEAIQHGRFIRALFVQEVLGDGGVGNHVIYIGLDDNATLKYYIKEKRDGKEVYKEINPEEFILSLAKSTAGVEVARYVNIVTSFSTQFFRATPNGNVFIRGIPAFQLLSGDQEYVGFTTMENLLKGFTETDRQRIFELVQVAQQLTLEFSKRNPEYIGMAGIDWFIYRDDRGKLQLGVSEMNARFTGTSHTFRFLTQLYPEIAAAVLDGSIHIAELDHAHANANSFKALLSQINQLGIPVFGLKDEEGQLAEEGIVFKAPVRKEGQFAFALIGPAEKVKHWWQILKEKDFIPEDINQ